MIRVLIVDDEPLARQRVRTLLADASDMCVIGEARNGKIAIDMIAALDPDVVFLDIEMPLLNGMEVVAAIGQDRMPVTVFLTAHDAFALQAFDAAALDYLTKPFDDRRFDRMLQRVRSRLAQRPPPTPPVATLTARVRGCTVLVALADIIWIAAAGDYVEVHAEPGATYLVDGSISDLADRLGARDFIRIHRSTLARRHHIRQWQPAGHGDGAIVLTTGETLRVSRTYAAGVRAWMNASAKI